MGSVNIPGLNIFAGDSLLTSVARTTGRVYWVGNATTFVPGGVAGVDQAGAHGNSPKEPFATIDYAVGQCTADRGDLIVVLPGHVESVTAAGGLELDVAGITILFLGDGATRGTIRFGTAVGADMNVTSANITFGAKGQDLGPRFLANLDALTGPIDVNAARFRMYGAKWNDGTTINTTDCVVADANADNMEIEDFEFVDAGAAGTQKQSFIQVAGATGVILRKIKCTGDFGTGIIENGTAWIDAELEELTLDNASATPTVCILLQATSSGWIKNSHLRVASGTTYLTANNDMQFSHVYGTGTDATATEEVGTQLAGGLEAKIDVIDEFHDVPAADNTLNAQINEVIGNKTDAAAAGAVTGTDTLVGYVKQLVTELAVVDEFHDVPAADNTLNAQINEVIGNKTDAAATGAVTTTDTLVGYIKQLVTQNGTQLDTDTLGSILVGTGGIATFPAAVHPADAVNLAEVMRSIWARNIAGINPLGTVVFVAASGGSDAAAGTSPNAPKATVASAITAAGAGGTIVLGPGTHSVDVSVAALTPLANQQFISAIPCFGGAPRAVIANDADDGANIVLVDVDGTVWRDIEFRNITAATICVTQVSVSQTTAVRGIHFENCWFNQNALDGAMISVAMNDATNATTGAVFKHCRFTGATGTTSVVVYIQVGVGGITRSLIEDCVFECQSADGDARAVDFLDPGAGGTSSYAVTIRHNDFVGPTDGGNDAVPISVAAAMTRDEIIPAIRNNFFHQCSTAPITIDKFNESTINNYVGDSATGGTLVDPGT